MTAVKRIRVKNRLAAVVRMPGGKTVAEAVASAEEQLDQIRDGCVDALDATLAEMSRLAAQMKSGPQIEQIEILYDWSNEIIGVAGVAALGAVGDAAYSFCELLDGFIEGAPWNWPAVEVHLNGLKLLRSLGDQVSDAQKEAVLDGLRAVVRRVGAADAED